MPPWKFPRESRTSAELLPPCSPDLWDHTHGGQHRPTPGIGRSEPRASWCKPPCNLSKEIRRVQPGIRLGPYEIVAPIGSGGMGDVHHAQREAEAA